MESVPVVALAFILCCLLCFINGGSSQCLDNLPQYGSRGTDRFSRDLIYIIPDYTFSCCGKVTQWGACVEKNGGDHDIVFSVYRPTDDPNCYSLVGFNAILDGIAIDGCVTLNVPVSDQISVEPGDVVGFTYSGGGPMGGIEIDTTVSSVTTWYNTLESFELGPPSCLYRLGPGENIPNSTFAAPVITAIVEAFPTSPPSPLHSTSQALSTPSPLSPPHSTSPVPPIQLPPHTTSPHLPAPSTPSPPHSTSPHSPAPSTPSPPHSTSPHSPVPSTPSPSTIPSPSSPTQDGGFTLSTSTVAGIAAGAVGGVLIIIIIILLIAIAIYKCKVTSTSTGKLRVEMQSSYVITSTNPMTHSEGYSVTQARDEAMEQNEAYQSAMDTVPMQQNEAYQSAMDTLTMEQNEAYSGTVVGALQDVTYEEVDGLYEELR